MSLGVLHRRPPVVDLPHDPLGHRNRIRNCGVHSRRRSAVPIVELPGCEDTRGDQQHALAAFVHGTQVYQFRLVFAMEGAGCCELPEHSIADSRFQCHPNDRAVRMAVGNRLLQATWILQYPSEGAPIG